MSPTDVSLKVFSWFMRPLYETFHDSSQYRAFHMLDNASPCVHRAGQSIPRFSETFLTFVVCTIFLEVHVAVSHIYIRLSWHSRTDGDIQGSVDILLG
jgi:hypothetical protein